MDDLLTVGEVAAELRVSELAVRNWINSGELEALRLGSHAKARLRVSRAALAAFVRPTGRGMTGRIYATRADDRAMSGRLRS